MVVVSSSLDLLLLSSLGAGLSTTKVHTLLCLWSIIIIQVFIWVNHTPFATSPSKAKNDMFGTKDKYTQIWKNSHKLHSITFTCTNFFRFFQNFLEGQKKNKLLKNKKNSNSGYWLNVKTFKVQILKNAILWNRKVTTWAPIETCPPARAHFPTIRSMKSSSVTWYLLRAWMGC